MNREQRRELTKRKWLSRAKKIYNSCGNFFIPSKGIKSDENYRSYKPCESITDFLTCSKYAKMLKKCTAPYRTTMEQIENKLENRRSRKRARRQIEDGIREWNDRCIEDEYLDYFVW